MQLLKRGPTYVNNMFPLSVFAHSRGRHHQMEWNKHLKNCVNRMDDAITGLDVKLDDLGRGLRRAHRHTFAEDVVDCSLDSQGSSIKCFKGCRAVRNPEGNDNIKLCHNLRSLPDCFVSHQMSL